VVAALVALALGAGVVLLVRAGTDEPADAADASSSAAATSSAASSSAPTDSDPAGCAGRDLSDRRFRAGAETGPIAGRAPVAGRVCAYDKGQLVGSRALSTDQAVELADAVRGGADGVGPEGRGCPPMSYDYTEGPREPHFTAHLTYADKAPTDLWVYGNVCTPSGVVNNVGRFLQLGPDLPALLGGLVRTPTPFPVTDASLPPGPVATGPMTVGECPDGVRTSRSRAHETARNAMLRLAAPMFASHPGARWAYAGIQDGIDEQAVVTADGSRVARFVANRLPGHRWLSVTVAETC
jgi:hypothetical protein